MYEEKSTLFMRLKFTEQNITPKAKEQIRNHALEIGNRSESDDWSINYDYEWIIDNLRVSIRLRIFIIL